MKTLLVSFVHSIQLVADADAAFSPITMDPQCLALTLVCALAAPATLEVQREAKKIIPILKQINQLNDDGSYTFGYESGDGSFRVETKDINGFTKGLIDC